MHTLRAVCTFALFVFANFVKLTNNDTGKIRSELIGVRDTIFYYSI